MRARRIGVFYCGWTAQTSLNHGTQGDPLPLLPSGPGGVYGPCRVGTSPCRPYGALRVRRPRNMRWRRERDSNPRYPVRVHSISSAAPSAARSSLPTQSRRFCPGNCMLWFEGGGEGGIRTRVGAFGPPTDFESVPLWPLRYLSASGFPEILQPSDGP